MTRQRRVVFDTLLRSTDHPTASDVFMEVKEALPGISLATVYNCLDTLTHGGMVKQVCMDREPSRYCANLRDHAHFHCSRCGKVLDVPFSAGKALSSSLDLPEGVRLDRLEVSLRGLCPACTVAAGSGTDFSRPPQAPNLLSEAHQS
ncbi:MAG TPA: transcriptional repressor [Verrucomicrobiales bacterium]|nr:transcriptional repressor [Verrucomicrobiales bacterium]